MMKRTLIYSTAFALASTAIVSAGSASAKTDDGRVADTDHGMQFAPDRWRLVKQTFRLHIPQNSKPLSQLIIDVPSTVAVSNDIDVLDELGQKININVSAKDRRIIIDFPGTVISNTKLIVELNKVKQPIFGPASVYSLSIKVVGSDVEIPVGVAQFPTLEPKNSRTLAKVGTVASVPEQTTAAQTTMTTEDRQTATVAPTSVVALDQIDPDSNSSSGNNDAMAQVSSVSQLSDVQPTDWAFQALQSLVERYGVIAGYPNNTFRGHRAMTRYELAAGLYAALNRVNELIATGTADLVRKEDLATLQKLQAEFATELAALHGRVDALEAHTSELSANQFSPTTKLDGEVIFAVTGGGLGNRGIRNSNTTPGRSPSGDLNQNTTVNPTVVARIRLNLSTSFTGKDLLFTELQSGNSGQTAFGVLGQDPGLGGNYRFNTFDLDYAGSGPSVALNYLFYKFPLFTKDLQVTIGPVDAVNSYVDINRYSPDEVVGFSSTFFKNNPLLFPVPGGAVASLSWNPGGKAFSLHAVYASGTAAPAPLSQPSAQTVPTSNFFGSPNQGIVELEFVPKKGDAPGPFALRLQYMAADVNQRNFSIGGVNAELALSPKIGLFGRYAFGSINGQDPGSFTGFANTTFTGTTLNPSTWQAGVGFLDLFIPGARGAIAVGQPFIESNVGNSTQTNVEAFYRIPLSDHIAITPDLQLIFNVNNNSANSTITVGTIRTVFTF